MSLCEIERERERAVSMGREGEREKRQKGAN